MNGLAKGRLWLAGTALSCVVFALPALAVDGGLDSRIDRLLNSNETTTLSRVTTIQVPGVPLAVFDISYVDRVLPYY